jgi:hypothetical protein
MRRLLFLLFIAANVSPAYSQGNTYAVFSVSDVWSNSANWSSGVPGALDTGIFRGDSLQGPCKVDQPFRTWLYFDVDDPPDNAFNDGGFPCTTFVPMRFVGAGGVPCTLGGYWVSQQSGKFVFDTGFVYETDSMLIYLEGANDSIQNISGDVRYIKRLTFGDEASDTMCYLATAGVQSVISRQLGGKGVFNQTSVVTFYTEPSAVNDFSFLDTSSYEIVSTNTGDFYINKKATSFYLPKVNATKFLNDFRLQVRNGSPVYMRGDVSVGGDFHLYVGDNSTFITNNHDITAYKFRVEQVSTSGGFMYYGSSVLDIGEGGYQATEISFGYGCAEYFQTSTWYCAGDFRRWGGREVDPGTAVVTLDGSSVAILRYGGNDEISWIPPDFIVDKSGAGSITLDQLGLPGVYPFRAVSMTVLDGDFYTDGNILWTSSDQSFTASVADVVELDSLDSIIGDGDFIFESGAGSYNTASCDLVLKGTGVFQNSSGDVRTIQRLSCAYPGKITTCSFNEVRLQNAGTPLVLHGGTLSIPSMSLYVRPTVSCRFLDQTGTLDVGHYLYLEPYANDIRDTIPRLTVGGIGTVNVFMPRNRDTVVQGDTIVTTGSYGIVSYDPGSFYDLAGQLLRLTSVGEQFKFGSNEADGYLRLQCNKGTIDVAGDIQSTSYNSAFTSVYSDSSLWRFGGAFDLGSGTDWIPDGGTIAATGTGSQTMTLNVDTVDRVLVAKPSGDLSTVGRFACLYFDVDSGLHIVDGDTLDIAYRYDGGAAGSVRYDSASRIFATGGDFLLALFTDDTVPPVQSFSDILRIRRRGGIGRLICGGDSILYDTAARFDIASYSPGDWDGYMNDTTTFWTVAPFFRCTLTVPNGVVPAPSRIRMRDCVWPENNVVLEYDSGAIDWGGNY